MISHSKHTNVGEMRAHPHRYFEKPADVVADHALNPAEKLTVLRAMEADARQRQVATEEGMSGGEEADLASVRAAIKDLESRQ